MMSREPNQPTAFGATLHYDDAGRVDRVDYSNGTREVRVYDEADRLTEIRHEDASQQVLYSLAYGWTINNWVASRTETDNTAQPATTSVVTFAYDNRGRLIGETRGGTGVPPVAYDLAYTYDQLGNRLSKTDNVGGRWTVYDYDVHQDWQPEDPYPTHHNRLLEYRVYDGDPGDPNEPNEPGTNLLRTVSYIYYKTGWASNITIKDEYVDPSTTPGDPDDYDWARDLALYYYSHGDLRLALWGKYQVDANGDPVNGTYVTEHAREFDNDSPRARYLMIDYDTNGSDSPYDWTRAGPLHWTDYDGVLPYGDADLTEVPEDPNDPNGPQVYDILEMTRYLGTAAHQTAATGDTQYHHGDLIGSTNLTTDNGGTPVSTVSYSALGELLAPTGTPGGSAPEGYPRYQYAGRYGYESNLLSLTGTNPNLPPITLQHLGARWYQPDTGRFVQRDPIGIEGGLNAYAYLDNKPLAHVDPQGLAVPHWTDGLPPGMVHVIGGGTVGGVLGGAAAAVGPTATAGAVAVSAGAGGLLAAGGAWIWAGGWAVCVQVADLVDTLDDLGKGKKKNRKQRRHNPEVFPPERPAEPRDIGPKDVPCGHPW